MVTIHLSFPSTSEVLKLLADVRFRQVVDELVGGPSELVTLFGMLSLDNEWQFIFMRYCQGRLVKDIREAMGLSRYQMWQLQANVHYLLYTRLVEVAPDLARILAWEEPGVLEAKGTTGLAQSA